MQCVRPIRLQIKHKSGRPSFQYPDGLLVPCGKCIGCRIKARSEWSLRMLHELESHNDSCFITLTYNDRHLPDHGSLRKRDMELFLKRLRKSLGERRIRYFGCGEYGDTTDRPHYHLIIFGLSLGKDDRNLVKVNWPYADWNVPAISRKAFGLVEPDSIRYVAQYIDKKFTGELAEEEYVRKNREPIFKRCSIGLGRAYCDLHRDRLVDDQCVHFRGAELSLPRYYVKRLGLTNELSKAKSIERDIEVVKHYTGVETDSELLYKYASPEEVRSYIEGVANAKKQHELNLQARITLKNTKI